MSYPHRIRLRGPWVCQPLEADSMERTLPQDREVAMPGCLRQFGLPGFSGEVLFRRNFGYPGRIDSWERVWLTCDDIAGKSDICLNDKMLGKAQTGRFAHDVTDILKPHNKLEVFLRAESDSDGLPGEVAMEVRALVYLENLHVKRDPEGAIQVKGSVVGSWPELLEIYAILDRRNVHYQTTLASTSGQSFAFTIPADQAQGSHLRIELVNRSQVWYVFELDFSSDAATPIPGEPEA